jgi:hypothetical protein
MTTHSHQTTGNHKQATPHINQKLVPRKQFNSIKMSSSNDETQESRVTIIVGREESTQTFVLLKEPLCQLSPVFNAAFKNSNFLEGETQSMTLDDVQPDVFKLLVEYMEIFKVRQKPKPFLMHIARFVFLCDRFLRPVVQNAAMKTLCCVLAFAQPEETLAFCTYVYDTFKSDYAVSKRVAIDHVAFGGLERVEAILDDLPVPMIIEVTKVLFHRTRRLDSWVDHEDRLDTELNFKHYLVKEPKGDDS